MLLCLPSPPPRSQLFWELPSARRSIQMAWLMLCYHDHLHRVIVPTTRITCPNLPFMLPVSLHHPVPAPPGGRAPTCKVHPHGDHTTSSPPPPPASLSFSSELLGLWEPQPLHLLEWGDL